MVPATMVRKATKAIRLLQLTGEDFLKLIFPVLLPAEMLPASHCEGLARANPNVIRLPVYPERWGVGAFVSFAKFPIQVEFQRFFKEPLFTSYRRPLRQSTPGFLQETDGGQTIY